MKSNFKNILKKTCSKAKKKKRNKTLTKSKYNEPRKHNRGT
jgi:hypothetical protein